MSHARSAIHDWADCEGFDTAECRQGDELLDQVEDDRVHAEALKLLKRGEELKAGVGNQSIGMAMAATLIVEAVAMDPYEERDGQLVRKSDGKPVTL